MAHPPLNREQEIKKKKKKKEMHAAVTAAAYFRDLRLNGFLFF